jgi:hypothetical protein
MSIVYYILTTSLLLTAIMLALSHKVFEQSALLWTVRSATVWVMLITSLIFQVRATSAMPGWAQFTGAVLVIGLMKPMRRLLPGSANGLGWALALGAVGLSLAAAQLDSSWIFHHR